MPRTDEAEHWFNAVYSAVQEIPRGKVTSYGHIALLLGYPQRPRQVGICLKHLPSSPEEYFHSGNVPWQRVINSKGMISHRYLLSSLSLWGALGFMGYVCTVDGY
ncbi:6-O-methylguanine DNA methyltransferase [Aspergillus transmontanensis]|uniref:6-O-methylguanine DNA methyltransferase n=1 Tax=Aspergillus transmontanensis TaxID=1034304 RepID=A0A5N6VXX1_9EURO|nr:6-O-methylguanine DNA methyltransferase [Aspergillus transmontanensis]